MRCIESNQMLAGWKPSPRAHVCAPYQIQSLQKRQVRLIDHSATPLPYERVWKLQKRGVESLCRSKTAQETILLVQHEPVYTLGAGSSLQYLRAPPESLPHPLFRTERGGEVTYHGPGQLVLYPLLNLRNYNCDLHWYLRQLEEVALVALREVSGIEGRRIEGFTGVWIGDAKVAAIGIRAKRWVTYHGLALNVAMDLTPFESITPCGIYDRGVTCVQDILQHSAVQNMVYNDSVDAQLMDEYRFALIEAFSHVFGVEIVSDSGSSDVPRLAVSRQCFKSPK